MKTKKISRASIVSEEIPYSEELLQAAQSLIEESETEQFDPIELIGRASLASLISTVANGKLDKDKSYQVLKTFAEKKTPSPVQKVEQTTKLDMRMVFAELVASNDAKRAQALGQAELNKKAIIDKLKIEVGDSHRESMRNSPNYALAANFSEYPTNEPIATSLIPVENQREAELSGTTVRETSVPPEPIEIQDIRRGGDGSLSKIALKRELSSESRATDSSENGI